MIINFINLKEQSFVDAQKFILELCIQKIKLTNKDINFILNLEEKELVNIFFNEYCLFDNNNFLLIEKYTNNNLDINDKDFVSDLIYFARDFGLDLNYKKIISFLIIEIEDNNCFVLACLEYLSLNIKFLYIEQIIKNLKYIRNNVIYNQNEQVLASLILFRITQNSNYLLFVKELIEYDNTNLKYLNNSLKEEMYDEKYFNLSELKKYLGLL